ncbi:MAG: DUF3419 family protein [Gemmatimonadetes bacterium]|nr:DUF3419 family protein [Gemmatimonadota bacterium]NIQ56622.1 DUF3419 family protein [Gemmatimonadota bacterium]NIU76821.1 DUF3419 family protein [Gammaproteobacteria bacterium]NIX46200.1 DUF3419 family protein [Gemmatimonadota bacterium]NIY10534.1 DUF3419 family protein [Gemmatimonadota bacterium]
MAQFDATLNYSSVNEDWDTELQALQVRPGDDVICVTGSGARPLAVLAACDVPIVALDVNPAQNHLLRLQIAAIRSLTHGQRMAWIGLHDADPRWRLRIWRRRIAPQLSRPAREWWRAHTRMLARGVLYAGRWERHFRRVSRLARRVWPIDTLLAFQDLEEQRRWLADHWDDRLWRAAWAVACHPGVSRLVFGDPAFHGRLDRAPGPFLRARMRRHLETHLARSSFMVSLVLRGALSPEDLPPHLTEAGASAIAGRLDRLTIVDDDIVSHLRGVETGRYSRFSLSDLPSFMDQAGFDGLWHAVRGAARPGSRVVVRQFLRRPDAPAVQAIRRERVLERTLARRDRAFAYDFVIAVVGEEDP